MYVAIGGLCTVTGLLIVVAGLALCLRAVRLSGHCSTPTDAAEQNVDSVR
ncbi:hypothetical protein [Nocardia sp. NPDC052112]